MVGWVVGWEKQPIQVPPADGAACGRCHGLGTATPNQMMRVGTSFADWSHMLILTRNLFCHHPVHQRRSSGRSRRICAAHHVPPGVMLIPQSQGGTLSSIQDARETLPSEADLPSTFPASSGAVRRLVLVSNSQEDRSTVPSMDMAHNSARSPQEAPGDAEDPLLDTATVGGMSEAGEEVLQEFTFTESPIIAERRTVRPPTHRFAALSDVDLKSCFTFRACVMRTVPHIMKGAFRLAIRTALEEILEGHRSDNDARMARGWKLFMLLPRMLLFRPRHGGPVPRKQLEERVSGCSCWNKSGKRSPRSPSFNQSHEQRGHEGGTSQNISATWGVVSSKSGVWKVQRWPQGRWRRCES